MRARALTLGVVTVPVLIALFLAALPREARAQSTTTTRGAFGGPLSGDATQGALRGALPQGATVGAARGSLPPGAVVGAVGIGTPTTPGTLPPSGVFLAPLAVGMNPAGVPVVVGSGAVFVGNGAVFLGGGAFRGPVSPDTVGAMGAPLPPGTVLGDPGPAEIAQRLQTEARLWLQDGNFAQGEAMLNRSVAIREEIAGGPNHPEVAQALEDNAKLLREWHRDAAASDMEARAKEIRTNLEPPAPPKAPPRF